MNCHKVYIYSARDLPAADDNGTADPFIKVWDLASTDKKTDYIEDNTNPAYYQTLELEYETREKGYKSFPPFILDVFDRDADLLDSTDDFMGRCVILPTDCALVD